MGDPRIVVFDVETTGTDRRSDQVIELCVQFGVEDDAVSRTWRIKPSCPMSRGAEAVHGISMADLADCPSFADVAGEIRQLFTGARVWVGYNLSFDIDMLQAEFARLEQPLLDLEGVHIVDAFRLWQQCEPRSLQDAHRRFVGGEFGDAHSAAADVAATGRVLRGMVAAFGLEPRWATVSEICQPDRKHWAGPSRHLQWDDGGELVFGFGRHQGESVVGFANSDNPDQVGYLRWIADKDFPLHVIEACRQAAKLSADEFRSWSTERFGGPAAAKPASAAVQSVA